MSYEPSGEFSPDQLCAVCRQRIDDQRPPIWCFATLDHTSPLKAAALEMGGSFIETGFVTAPDFRPIGLLIVPESSAHKQGIDLAFQCCSVPCGARLKAAMDADMAMYSRLDRQ